MDMSSMDMSGMSSSRMGGMSMMSHFTASLPSTPLWFSGWQPTTAGTTFAACLGLFGLTILTKLLGAIRHQANLAWSTTRWQETSSATQILDKVENSSTMAGSAFLRSRTPVPWVAQHEVTRGLLAGFHAALDYFLMLAVMSYNVYFFIAIVLGHFAGEVAFGRWSSIHAGGSHS